MQKPQPSVQEQFAAVFPGEGRVHVVRSPGRVNLIGEHTDYNEGFVFPMAIEPEVRLAYRGRDDGRMRLASTHFPGQVVEFALDQPIERGEPAWANYLKGVAAELKAAGIPLTGMDVLVANTLPVGGGLSSSAALEVGMARAILHLGGLEMDQSRLALLCQKAEHEFALVPCGIMDQTIVAGGRSGHAMLLDCRDLSRQFIPIDPAELRVVIVNTMVRHELSGTEYADRRKQCEAGVRHFARDNANIKALRDLTAEQVQAAKGQFDQTVWKRCLHIVTENQRTFDAARLLVRREYEEVGQLMVASHESLRDHYEVSCPELDFLAAEAMKVKGVYGARMTGGGFGGCIVALAQPRAVENVVQRLETAYKAEYDIVPASYITTATAGAEVVG